MKQLFKILLSVAVVTAMVWACKKTEPEKPKQEEKKDTTFVLEAVVTSEANYDGTGEISYTVKSIKKIKEKEEFMPWTMEFSTDGGQSWTTEKPEFVTVTTKEENGDLTAKTYNATFAAQEKTLQTSDIILKAKPVLSNVDLSMVDIHGEALTGGQSTANCYVIHNPGTYKFPTIYGNAKKNGATNESAYKSSKTGNANVLENFIKADGKAITKPEIEGIKDACLIWQDTKDLISDIKFADNYISFEVKKETIHNGNAIIAVRDASNTILWSWHIWVTERDLHPVEVENFQNEKYNFMPVNLGWCGFGNEWYAPREVKARLKQEGGKTVDLTFNQKQEVLANDYDIKNGNNPYYQWGRKDPMLPSDGFTAVIGKDKTCYPGSAEYKFKYGTDGLNTKDIKEYIKNPHKFNIKLEMKTKYYNLWSNDNDKTTPNDDTVIKTVYDPSPVGYTVPAPNAFTGFTSTGQDTNTSSEFNVKGNFDKGWHFYSRPGKQGPTLFFPVCGWRNDSSGTLEDVSIFGNYWTAGPYDTLSGRRLGFYSDGVYTLNYYYRSYGYAVRCAEEK